MMRSQTYNSWSGMLNRCKNKDHPKYEIYGGRGITVSTRWMVFKSFLEDMGESPAGYSIERIDNDKGYDKDNCKWIPFAQQARNRRSTILNIEDVLEIRWLLSLGYKAKQIAPDYKVSKYTVWDIKSGRSWKDIKTSA